MNASSTASQHIGGKGPTSNVVGSTWMVCIALIGVRGLDSKANADGPNPAGTCRPPWRTLFGALLAGRLTGEIEDASNGREGVGGAR
jgi:hypothetical protein